LPVVIAYGRADETERAFWRRTLEKGDVRDGDLEEAIAHLRRHGAIEATIARARRFAEEAHQALAIYPDGEMRRALAEAVDFAVARNR
jgi:octaprenyl-diphosphate synthase